MQSVQVQSKRFLVKNKSNSCDIAIRQEYLSVVLRKKKLLIILISSRNDKRRSKSYNGLLSASWPITHVSHASVARRGRALASVHPSLLYLCSSESPVFPSLLLDLECVMRWPHTSSFSTWKPGICWLKIPSYSIHRRY